MKIECAYKELVSLEKIIPNPRNPNTHSKEQIKLLAKIIDAQGWRAPITVSTRSGFIVRGHGRLLAAQLLKYDMAPVDFQDYESEAQEWADLIADNRIAELAEIDQPILKDLLQELDDGSFDMDLTGFDSSALEGLMLQTHEEGQTDDDEVPEPQESICKPGDLWVLGNHRLLCGDSTVESHVAKLMAGEKAVLMATDPPYGDSWVQKAKDMHAHGYGHSRAVRHGSIASDDKTGAELKQFILDFLIIARIAGNPPFPAYVWHGAKRIIFEQAMVEAGYLVHQPVIWIKPSFVIGRLHYHPQCEWALHGWLQGHGECPFYGQRNQSDIWKLDRENDKLHPTQKPVGLFEIPIKNHTRENEICYEPFAGSGTQFIACEKLGRSCYGMEIDPHYCDVIINRWQNFTGKTAELQ
ncbi:MAG: DNA methyltransferase [Dehalococcoidales bacterium]|nr:DNA methyltransferase [Dehalococcoidales bacterium]